MASDNARPHPPSFYCPISHQCMHDPVVLSDGHTYEKCHIQRWLPQHFTSPVSGMKLEAKTLVPNHALRNAIEEYFAEVLSGHRQAIRRATADIRRNTEFSSDSLLVRTIDSLMECSVLINADLSVEHVLKRIMEEAKSLVGAEVASVFLVDWQGQELYSTVNSTGGEIRIPIKSGVAGHVVFSGLPLIIRDAYSDDRFNATVDTKTGFQTRNILCVPVRAWKGSIIGVVQLINKTPGGVLQGNDQLDFATADQQFLQVMAAQAGAAITNSGMFEQTPNSGRGAEPAVRTLSRPSLSISFAESSLSDMTAGVTRSPSVVSFGCDQPSIVRRSSSIFMKSINSRTPRFRRSTVCDAVPIWNGSSGFPMCQKAMMAVKPLLAAAVQNWEMDTLALSDLTGSRPLQVLAEYIFIDQGLIESFAIDHQKLACFLATIEQGYPEENPYHNRAHAASVLHFMHAFVARGGIAEAAVAAASEIDDSDRRRQFIIMVSVLAAIVHDYEHEGLTNDFLVKTLSEKAISHNDKSPNENHHVAAAFEVLLQPQCNFLAQLATNEFRLLRKLVVQLVLGTDMAQNKDIVLAFQTSSNASAVAPFAPSSSEGAMVVLQMALKCADIGHLALGWSLHMQWVRRLEAEFFAQGDQEKHIELPEVSFLMDREKPGVTETQVGFFDFVVFPLVRTFAQTFPSTSPVLLAVEENYQRWCEIATDVKRM